MKPTAPEILSHLPAKPSSAPPLLFIHGAFVGAWCWEEHFLPWFAAQGYEAHALSLSGHGNSPGRNHLDSLSIADYVADVAHAVSLMSRPPVLIGHSMGGFVVQKYLEDHPAEAAILMCTVPPQGLLGSAVSMMFSKPAMITEMNAIMTDGKSTYQTLQTALFAQDVSLDDLMRYFHLSQPESHRALWDMTLFSLPRTARALGNLPGGASRLLVIGAELDHQIPVSAAEMTGRSFGVEPVIYPGMGHGLMLEKDWEQVARGLDIWLNAHGLSPKQEAA